MIVIAATGSTAGAADLPAHTRLGEIFTGPSEARVYVDRSRTQTIDTSWQIRIPHPVPGYYGKPSDFEYRSYYGTSPLAVFGRLPYACGLYGYC